MHAQRPPSILHRLAIWMGLATRDRNTETLAAPAVEHEGSSTLTAAGITAEAPSPEIRPKIFIGHGRSAQWRDLKDHLTDKHGYQVNAYEVGVRSGYTITHILGEMLTESSFALIVMTGDDETTDGHTRARQNVVHELGLFQGRLGFNRAIMVTENALEPFSNIDGVQQIRFNHNIAETYGDVLATLRREFGNAR
jgi:predicted nucleotide-binding protein